jgi:Uma2 family endonuclease
LQYTHSFSEDRLTSVINILEIEMHTLQEIKQAILQLPAIERESIASWLGDTAPSHSVAEPALAYGADQTNRLLTAEEYLEFEQTAELRHEFVAGTLYAMSGPSESHHRIAGNLFAAFHAHLRGGPCNAYISDFKLRLKAGQEDVFYYPDIMVACGREGMTEYYLEHPKLIIEVLSPSTEQIDRREKAQNYRQIATLQEYVLIAQKHPHVEIHRRADGWGLTALNSLDDAAEFRSIGLSLPLRQMYEDVPNTRTTTPT